MLDLSTQRLLFNDKYHDYNYFKDNKLPVPIFIAIPTIAYHVSITRVYEKRNIIQETILYLKRNGVPKNEISKKLCLHPDLVNIVISNSKKNMQSNENDSVKVAENEEQTEDFYIFYNLITNEFIDGYMRAKDFNDNCCSINHKEFSERQECYYLHENIGSSYSTKIHFLGSNNINFDKNKTPSQEEIISCHKYEALFNKESYRNARYLNEMYSVWLSMGYSITQYNSNEYYIINPFKTRISFSTYLTNIVKQFKKTKYLLNDIEEYEKDTEGYIIKKQNERIVLKNNNERLIYSEFEKKYSKFGYFSGNNSNQTFAFESNLVKMQNEYNMIKKNIENKDCSDNVRNFYDFANNALEQLFIIIYRPFMLTLPEQLKENAFFDKMGKEKNYEGERQIIKYYFDEIETNHDLSKISCSINTDYIKKAIKSGKLGNDNTRKLGLKDLFGINAINMFYNKETKFSNIFKFDIPHLIDTICLISENRNIAKHTLNKQFEFVEFVSNTVYEIVDAILEVNQGCDVAILNIDISDDYSNFIGQYGDIDDFSLSLKESCNQLLMDVYNSNEQYFSDCVIAFERASQIILDFVMRKINSKSDLKNYLNLIPDDEDEAKILLMTKLEDIGINFDFDRIRLHVSDAKKCILNNYNFKLASTLILFAPLLLSVVDYLSFITLFEKLGLNYFEDAIDSINARGHDSLSTDWKHIKIINDRYLNYCKILTSFDREEL